MFEFFAQLQAVVGHAVAKASEIARSDCHALAEAVGDDVATHIVEWAAKARPISDMNLFEGKIHCNTWVVGCCAALDCHDTVPACRGSATDAAQLQATATCSTASLLAT